MRQSDGRETWSRLLNWDKGQAPSERLASQILSYENYKSIDPSHPLGGKDGLKDILCEKDNLKFVAAAYFPRGQELFSGIKTKFLHDIKGIEKNSADGIAFITNQELRLSERDELTNLVTSGKRVDIFHLERISSILNYTQNYGVRLEFLDIEMTKEEQLAYMAVKDSLILDLKNYLIQLDRKLSKKSTDLSNSSSIYVTPEYISRNISLFSSQRLSHKCSYCGYGFKILNSGSQIVTNSSIIYAPYNPIAFNSDTIKLITCPKCGNTEEHY